jgi:PHP family Zn ribbon phosphoesterase
MSRYRIIRMNFNKPNRAVRGMRGLTLEQAQAHCARPDTRARGTCQRCQYAQTPKQRDSGETHCPACGDLLFRSWFDGYDED